MSIFKRDGMMWKKFKTSIYNQLYSSQNYLYNILLTNQS